MLETTISSSRTSSSAMMWKSIMGLAFLEASITIGWLAYEKFQPVLLAKFNFTELAAFLLVAQGVLGAIFHPVSGNLADRMTRSRGSKFPVIISGISFAAVIFLAVSLTTISDSLADIRWLLPVLVVLWLAAMSTFHSPAISLVESFAPIERFPRVAAILAIVFGLIYALEPFIIPILKTVGIPVTFVLGGMLLVGSGFALKNLAPKTRKEEILFDEQEVSELSNQKVAHNKSPIALLFAIGFFIGLFKSTVFFVIPMFGEKILKDHSLFSNNDYSQAIMLLSSALFSLPVSKLVEKWGAKRSLWIGCLITFILVVITFSAVRSASGMFVLIILLGMVYGLLSIASLPFVFKKVQQGQAGLGMGLYYGGVSAATAIILLLLLQI